MDQKKFSQAGLETEFVGEAQHDPCAISSVQEGKVQLLYISPESLLRPQTCACAHTTVNNALCNSIPRMPRLRVRVGPAPRPSLRFSRF